MSDASWTCRIISTSSYNSFETFEVLQMIQKQGYWMPYELKPRDVEQRLFTCEQLLQWQKRKGFLHCIMIGDQKWIHYDNAKHRRLWDKPGHISTSSTMPNIHDSKLLLWWDQLSAVYYELLKPNETITISYRREIAIDYNWCVWVKHWRKNGCYTSRDTIKWFCDMTMLDHMLHNLWKPTWKRLNRKSYSTVSIRHSLPIITCSDGWYMTWLSSTSILMKMPKNGSTLG